MPGGSEAEKGRTQDVEFRHYVFTAQEVHQGIEKFLQYVGYQLQPIPSTWATQPDIYATRREGDTLYEIIGVVRQSIDEAAAGLTLLKQIRGEQGDNADYVLVLPPINEYLLLEFLLADKGKWFYGMKQERQMIWMHNPQDETTWCFTGAPEDKRFQDYFVLGRMQVDFFLHQRLARELMAEEEEY
jgi:hypothetical protein